MLSVLINYPKFMIPTPQTTKPAAGLMNVWAIVSIILAVALIAVLVANYATGGSGINNLSADEAGGSLTDFLNKIYGPQLGAITLTSVTEENGLYKITVGLLDQTTNESVDQVVYTTRDGKLFIPQVVNIAEALDQFDAFQEQQEQSQQPLDTAPATDEITTGEDQEATTE